MDKGARTHGKGHGEVGSRSWIKNVRRSLNFQLQRFEQEVRRNKIEIDKSSANWIAQGALAQAKKERDRQKDKMNQLDEKGLVVRDGREGYVQLSVQGRMWNEQL